VAKEPIQFAEDVESMHFIFKREYVLLVDLVIQKKLDTITGLKIDLRRMLFN